MTDFEIISVVILIVSLVLKAIKFGRDDNDKKKKKQKQSRHPALTDRRLFPQQRGEAPLKASSLPAVIISREPLDCQRRIFASHKSAAKGGLRMEAALSMSLAQNLAGSAQSPSAGLGI